MALPYLLDELDESPPYDSASYLRSSGFDSSFTATVDLSNAASPFDTQRQQLYATRQASLPQPAAPPGWSPLAADDDGSVSFASSPSSDSLSFPALPASPSLCSFPAGPQPARGDSGRQYAVPSHAALPSSQAPGKRRRVADQSAEQRLERRRAQHRAVDASRRQKEHEAIDRLHRLLRQQQQQTQQGALSVSELADETDDIEVESANGSSYKKAGRLTVLESSIAMIQQLTIACKHMEAACNAKDAQLSRVSSHLHSVAASIAHQAAASVDGAFGFDDAEAQSFSYASPSSWPPPTSSSLPAVRPYATDSVPSTCLSILPPATSSYLTHCDRSHSLRSGGLDFVSSSLCVTVVAPPGVILSVNDRFLECSGWRRSDLLHTSFETDEAATLPLTPLVQATRAARHGAGGDDSRQRRYLPQYPGAEEQVRAMMRGEHRRAQCRWRCRMGDGTLLECDSTFWAVYDAPAGRDATQKRLPDRMVFIIELEDAHVVEPADAFTLREGLMLAADDRRRLFS